MMDDKQMDALAKKLVTDPLAKKALKDNDAGSLVRFMSNNPEFTKGLTPEEKDILNALANDAEISEQDISDALANLADTDPDVVMEAASFLTNGVMDGEIAFNQQKRIVRTVLQQKRLYQNIDQPDDNRGAYPRMAAALIAELLLGLDSGTQAIMTAPQRSQFFTWAETYVLKEKNQTALTETSESARTLAWGLLMSAYLHPLYPQDKLNQLSNEVLAFLHNFDTVFMDGETAAIARVFYVLAARKRMSAGDLLSQIKKVTEKLNGERDEQKAPTVFRSDAWYRVLSILAYTLQDADHYRQVRKYINAVLTDYYQKDLAFAFKTDFPVQK